MSSNLTWHSTPKVHNTMPEPSSVSDLFYLVLALVAIFVPLGTVAFIVTHSSLPKKKNRDWRLR